eukprot:4105170-Lingulodinium_polyedra.AAC.1
MALLSSHRPANTSMPKTEGNESAARAACEHNSTHHSGNAAARSTERKLESFQPRFPRTFRRLPSEAGAAGWSEVAGAAAWPEVRARFTQRGATSLEGEGVVR